MDCEDMRGNQLAQDTDRWQAVVNKVRKLESHRANVQKSWPRTLAPKFCGAELKICEYS